MNTAEAVRSTGLQEREAEQWTEIIKPKTSLLDLQLGEVWRYRDFVMMFVRRDFVSNYKQTILGPLWFIIQPLLTTLTYVLIFGVMAGFSTGSVPRIVFYLAGITIWNYFADCLNKTAVVFQANAHIFGKVYFPRLAMPVSIVISNLVRFFIQLGVFAAFWLYYLYKGSVHPNTYVALLPLLILMMGLIGFGLGMAISALTTKYKDLIFLLGFGVQLLMYATPVIYPLSRIPQKYQWVIKANPLTPIVETFKYGFLGDGVFSWGMLGYSALFTLVSVIIGIIIFNKVEKSFMDTI